jgi:hypothetical protein
MPTLARIGPYRFFFASNDRTEPPHVHVRRDDCLAKFWLAPVQLQDNIRFTAHELRKIELLIREHEAEFSRQWHERFGE